MNDFEMLIIVKREVKDLVKLLTKDIVDKKSKKAQEKTMILLNFIAEKTSTNIVKALKKRENDHLYAQRIITSYLGQFNEFKRTIDRKYALYDFFKSIKPEYGYEVHKYIGSNQVRLEYDNQVIYDSEKEEDKASPERFTEFFRLLLLDLLDRGQK